MYIKIAPCFGFGFWMRLHRNDIHKAEAGIIPEQLVLSDRRKHNL